MLGRPAFGTALYNPGGSVVPDIVGQLRYDSDWGSLAAQAAGHEARSDDSPFELDNGTFTRNNNKYGFAVGGTVLIKIPAIDGGHFIVEGQYADGATDYLGVGNTVIGGSDHYYNPIAGSAQNGKGWSIVAELGGNITPQLNANLVGSYIDTQYNNFFFNPDNGALFDYGIKEFTVAGNLTYTIVKGLSVSGEVAYTRVQQDNTDIQRDVEDNITGYKSLSGNVWQGGIRLKRQF